MEQNTTVIDAHELTKIYNGRQVPVKAIDGVHLHLEEGEFAAVVGPSGSGKSTLLHLIGGLDTPTSGNVVLAGTEITRLSEHKLIDFRLHHIGFVFQAYNLVPVLTARENIGFVMQLQGLPRSSINKRVDELLAQVDMIEKADVKPAKLSGGQQQRVAVARALASRPRIVLADEPTANLDSVNAGKLLDLMARLNREEHITFLFSTHDPRVIEKARRVITLVDGRVVSDTRPG
ncbi:MAG: ABC transporter ATP-binding protein [Bacteroidetes bacterium]|nr:ABC transporter ATP-binding protein [Bacteroidota bacterium]